MFDSPFFFWTMYFVAFFGVCAMVSGIAYVWAYLWTNRDNRIEATWTVVATGTFDYMTDGLRPFVRLQDGRVFPLVLQHAQIDLEPGEAVSVLRGHCKRYRLERRT